MPAGSKCADRRDSAGPSRRVAPVPRASFLVQIARLARPRRPSGFFAVSDWYKTGLVLKRRRRDDDTCDGSPGSSHGEETGAPKWWHRSEARGREASGPGKTWPTDRCHGRPNEEIRVERDGRPESLPSISRYSRRVLSMLKPLTLSLSLAVALGLCSVSKAGLHDNNCTTCGLASPQGVVASPQSSVGCGDARLRAEAPLRQRLEEALLPPQVTYEWVLKKKHNWFGHGGGCSTCGTSAPVYATGQGVAPRRASTRPRRASTRPPRSTAPGSTRSSRPARRPASPRFPPR